MKSLLICSLVAAALQGGEMITVRKSEDSKFMGFKSLRVINQDIVDPKKGFDTHPHKDMEILTYILDGTLEHKDTMGNHSQIQKGEFQLMSAGTGVEHSEFNPSKDKIVHLLQIWIYPEKKGLAPEYQQKSFANHQEGLKLVVSPDGKEGSLKIHQDARVYLGRLKSGVEMDAPLAEGHHAWIQMVHGQLSVNGVALKVGDGASLSGEKKLHLKAGEPAEFLLFDLK